MRTIIRKKGMVFFYIFSGTFFFVIILLCGLNISHSSSITLSSLQDSIDFLLRKFPDIILSVKDYGFDLHITVADSFWYNLTTTQQKQFADRMLDVIYASGDVKRRLYLKDQHSRIIAKQAADKIKGLTHLKPYMELRR